MNLYCKDLSCLKSRAEQKMQNITRPDRKNRKGQGITGKDRKRQGRPGKDRERQERRGSAGKDKAGHYLAGEDVMT